MSAGMVIYESINHCLVCSSRELYVLYPEITHTCGILNSLGFKENISSSVYRCKDCNHCFLSPRLSEETITNYYHKLNSEYFDKTPLHTRIDEDKKVLEKVKSLKESGKVLEIGCGNGFLLSLLRNEGYETFGIEPSPKAADFAKYSLNLNVVNGFLNIDSFSNMKFDIIFMMDVIEHLYQPNDMLKLCSEYLATGGIIVLLTGNVDSLNAKIWREKWFYFYSWEHISFFNKSSISKLLSRNNIQTLSYENISHSGGFLMNFFTLFVKNFLIYIYNFYWKRKYKHSNLAFDHMLVIGQKL
ncbi:MAG: class I SAM-dependent methyltransferase [Chitinophagales bacterium]|nr:class I SAM-dependent methyltransferase [Chitinophagales bacterium]